MDLNYVSLEDVEVFLFFFLFKEIHPKGRVPFGNLISASEIKEQWM